MNAGGSRKEVKFDYSSFMPIVLMTVGWCATVLIVNTLIIVMNPDNIQITSVVQSAGSFKEGGEDEGMGKAPPFPFGNKTKEPMYVDVQRDHLVLYPGSEVVPLRDLERKGNALERMLNTVQTNAATEYVVLLARPGTALVINRLKKAIRDRGIDIGCELYEADRKVNYDEAHAVAKKLKKD